MNKQEAIEEIKKLSIEKNGISHDKGNLTGVGFKDEVRAWDVICVLEKLDQPPKPVLPKFIDDYIKECRDGNGTLTQALFCLEYHKQEIGEWLNRNAETFARAWLDGYEVEKEQLYYVNLGKHIGRQFFLRKNSFSQQKWRITEIAFFAEKMTEQQIKEIDEHLWPFAEPVEETNE